MGRPPRLAARKQKPLAPLSLVAERSANLAELWRREGLGLVRGLGSFCL